MKFKLDENLGTRLQELFRINGHDVETVFSQGLQGCADPRLLTVCSVEGRCLVTFDLDFSDIRRFPPEKTAGVIVMRVPQNPSLELLEIMVVEALDALKKYPIEKKLWVVEAGRIRMHQNEEEK
jgi:predicted nuclease of predicted toxin-antitoxin system